MVDAVRLVPKDGTPAALEAKLEQSVETMRKTLNLVIEFQELRAAQQWAHYNALIKQGFTKEEALELVKGG